MDIFIRYLDDTGTWSITLVEQVQKENNRKGRNTRHFSVDPPHVTIAIRTVSYKKQTNFFTRDLVH